MLHVFHGIGVYIFYINILGYVQISQAIIIYFKKLLLITFYPFIKNNIVILI